MLITRLAPFLHILNLCLNQAGDADLCADLDLAGCNLGIVAVPADLATLLNFAVPAAFAGFVVLQHFQRHFARVEAILASLCRRLLKLFPEFKLKPTALEVFVKALVGFNDFAHNYSPYIFYPHMYRASAVFIIFLLIIR
jgi:hypothetical protein